MNDSWLITQDKYIKEEQSYYETLFALANGYVGIRNTLDFESEFSNPGTFFANIYDKALVTRDEIVNAPNWLDFTYTINGYPLLLDNVNILSFRRELDIKHGIVRTTYRVKDPYERITRIQREEFLYANDHHVALVRGSIHPENYSSIIDLTTTFNYQHGNSMYGGFLKEVRTHHLKQIDVQVNESVYLEVETIGTKERIGMASKFYVDNEISRFPLYLKNRTGEQVRIKVEEGQTYTFTKYVAFFNSHDRVDNLHDAVLSKLESIVSKSYNELLDEHTKTWENRWKVYDVVIEGDEKAQEAIRFAIYHLLQSPHPDKDGTNIASRGLTSEYHSGHFFFNTEIYKLPYFTYMQPDTARSLLQYRYNSLDAARKLASEMGYKGARFSEESDSKGNAAGPTIIKNIFTDEVLEEWTGRETQFIGALCVYAIDKYYRITQDDNFLVEYGLELLIETARFAASLVTLDNDLQQYCIYRVTGPDEYHMHVDNNFFTNYVIKYNLEYTLETIHRLKNLGYIQVSKIMSELGVSEKEMDEWKNISENIFLPPKRDGVYEQFSGYFNLKDEKIKCYDHNNRPVITEEFKDIAKLLLNSDNQIIKQCDVIMLMSLFRNRFSKDEKAANFSYYDIRTAHESSLSATHAAMIAIDTDQLSVAYKYFLICLRFNLDFTPREDYRNGIHLASYAGGWLVLVEGFAGIHINNNQLFIQPRLPDNWKKISFCIYWCRNLLKFTISQQHVEVEVIESGEPKGEIIINNNKFNLSDNSKLYVFTKPDEQYQKIQVKY